MIDMLSGSDTKAELRIILALRKLSSLQTQGTVSTVTFVDYKRDKPHVGELKVVALSPTQMMAFYNIDEREED